MFCQRQLCDMPNTESGARNKLRRVSDRRKNPHRNCLSNMLCTNALVTCSAQIPAQETNSAEFQIGSRIPTGITYPTRHTNDAELLIGALIPTGITYPTWHANEANVTCSAQSQARGDKLRRVSDMARPKNPHRNYLSNMSCQQCERCQVCKFIRQLMTTACFDHSPSPTNGDNIWFEAQCTTLATIWKLASN